MDNKTALAKMLGVSRRSLYYVPRQEAKDWTTKQMIEEVLRIRPDYGHKRLATHLKINKKRVLRVMKKYGIKPYRRTAKPKKTNKVKGSIFPNLLLIETPQGPGDIWATDFTYIKFKGKWWYVATVIDLFTREIVGWSIMNNHSTQLVMNALCHTLHSHAPPRILHSDQGSEYTSKDFTALCQRINIIQSMSAPGYPWENGYQESFYMGFKVSLGEPKRFETVGELVAGIYKTINYYHRDRIHSALGMAPRQFALQAVLNYN